MSKTHRHRMHATLCSIRLRKIIKGVEEAPPPGLVSRNSGKVLELIDTYEMTRVTCKMCRKEVLIELRRAEANVKQLRFQLYGDYDNG